MDDKGYAFTPLALLLMIPVVILAISYSGIVNEVNLLSAIVIGGDVTATVASDVVNAIQQDTADAGRRSAFMAVQSVINSTNVLADNQPFFSTTGNTSRAYIADTTADTINVNITNTCRDLEKQTGRIIYINGSYVNPNNNDSAPIYDGSDLSISQDDPFGFTITIPSIAITVVQNSSSAGQNVTFNTPAQNAYVSIEGLEDPYIWVNAKERISSVFYKYPYYDTYMGKLEYHFADNASASRLDSLYDCLVGANTEMGYRPYYFPDSHGLTFFDRLEGRTNSTSAGPDSAKMSTFILYDPLQEDHGNNPISMLDHEYFASVIGYTITTKHGSTTTTVMGPDGKNFLISTNYSKYLNLSASYSY
ncbi:hypothetical protein [Methanobacterium sp. MBAC-LM]|uniref:hypothetical protein n=1 Tax=Methanobacterium sp. MBAC-LM TaxID=3412034 RepID=UPI003C751D05